MRFVDMHAFLYLNVVVFCRHIYQHLLIHTLELDIHAYFKNKYIAWTRKAVRSCKFGQASLTCL